MDIKLSWNRRLGCWHIWDAHYPTRLLFTINEVIVEGTCRLSNETQDNVHRSWLYVDAAKIYIDDVWKMNPSLCKNFTGSIARITNVSPRET